MKKSILSILIISFLLVNPLFGQKDKHFDTSNEYLDYLEKKFKIEPSEVHYLSTESDSINGNLDKFGILVLITQNKLATIYEVADTLGIECSPSKLMPKITTDAIEAVSDDSKAIDKVLLKSLETGESLKLKDEKIAIYVFSHRFGKRGNLFIKEKEFLEALGYKTIVLSIDGAYIKDITDIDKTPVYVQ